jgi:hypothetical protein
MRTRFLAFFAQTRRALAAGVIALAGLPAFATTFTNNTIIGVGDTNYDGQAIVVTNCIVTVDGPHAFASVQVAAGGLLTHSFYPGGVISNLLFVTNESQVLMGTNPVTLLDSNVVAATVSVTDITGMIDYTNGLDYLLMSTNGILTELERTTNSSIPDGATVLVSYEALLAVVPAGLDLTVTNNVEVDLGGAISANGNGYGGGLGAGAGHSAGDPQDGSGASYGGLGGTSSSNAVGGATYGSFTQPANLGSGGGAGDEGPGGAGGGLIEIVAGGSVIVNGSITANGANGTNSRSGGGSGGSVWLTALALSGSGAITANGGAGEPPHGGGGGGGRIAFQGGASSFTGSVSAYGGSGANSGGAGTVYTQLTGENGLLVVDNGGQLGTNTTILVTNETIDVLIQGNAGVVPTGPWNVGDLTIASNGLLLTTTFNPVNLIAAGDITIEAGGGLLANADGYSGGNGSGAGRALVINDLAACGGAGYGGNGAGSSLTNTGGGLAYGMQDTPGGYGSGGGNSPPESFGGNGGGAIQITSLGGIVQVNGTLSANGGNGTGYGGGGGSGGTIVLTGGTLLGSGSIAANGGYGANSIGGGGGGGRIAISPAANLFGGTISAYGGGGGNWGGAGTVLLQVPQQTAQLILDNDGNNGTNTLVQTASAVDLIVRNGAVASSVASVAFADLYLDANGWLAPTFNASFPFGALNFTFTGNATIQPGGGIVANNAGFLGAQGTGAGGTSGSSSTNLGGGGGHGGYGASSFGSYAAGGNAYDTINGPTQPGGSGGAVQVGSLGGIGGGLLKLTVIGALEMDGIITANGGNGSGYGGGGGAGGSIWLAVGSFSGAGSIAANGGNGANGLGGGGGGGMIFISCTNNSYAGTITAYGGGGDKWGGAGTVLIQATGLNGQLILDNGGHSGTNTPLQSVNAADLIVRSGARGTSPAEVAAFIDLYLNTNGWLVTVANTESDYTLNIAFTGNATIQAGGGIVADFAGYPGGQGPGEGHIGQFGSTNVGSGGGNGGYGGNSFGNYAAGGSAVNLQESGEPGSGGGSSPTGSPGGAGGGVVKLTVTGTLELEGIITANGGNGSGLAGGGGSGGSISLSAGTLSGAGSITANGGNGAGSLGGGGGGGVIDITCNNNSFSGALTAYGGGGANWGGPGPILIQIEGQEHSQLILDGGGHSGPVPTVIPSEGADLTLRNGAMASANTYTSLGNVVIGSNAWFVQTSGGYDDQLTFSSATIQAGGGIIADYAGFAAGEGSGSGHLYQGPTNYPCSGAGHGGYGANSAGNLALGGAAYDSPTSPSQAGSGGGSDAPYSVGGAGGGGLRVIVTGLLELDGAISANGANGGGIGGGGGAGGGIYITAGTWSGAGSITANGGNGAGSIGGGGAGGCIAITSTVNQFAGTISAYGGGGANWGGAGTVYIQTTGQTNQFILDNDGKYGASTPLTSIGSSSLTVRNGAVGLSGPSLNLGAVLISSNGWLLASNYSPVSMTFSSATIQAGGGIIADSEGYGPGQGTGEGHSYESSPNYPCSGAGHGGLGANSAGNSSLGGSAYDEQTTPTSFGSGGGSESPYSVGGAGGGAFRLTVSGRLQNDGVISANGGNGGGLGGGGGSGGSIYLTAATLSGAGSFAANGGSGAGSIGGGGAGGCIALYLTANQFTGAISAYGGGGANWGGAGSVYIQATAQTSQFILDNDGQYGAATPIQASSDALILRNGAAGYLESSPQTFLSLLIGSNGWLVADPVSGNNYPGIVNLSVTANATIEAGGGIVTDAAGSAAGLGSGAGHFSSGQPDDPCSGAGYGGNGAGSSGNLAMGGTAYGSATSPSSLGSGGGNDVPYSLGGAGGGSVRLTVNGTLAADGKISANGGNGSGVGGGGGSGGSVWLTVGTLTGSGSITANGGTGADAVGGGGGGGRISLGYSANDFVGLMSASGGGGYAQGGSGTIYTKANSQSVGQLLLDNGGTPGADTPLSSALGTPTQPFNLTIQNGAVVSPQTSFPLLNNLTVASGGSLTVQSNQSILDLLVFDNVDVASGGAIVVDGEGYDQANGPGAGQSIAEIGSGAGYGGVGGASATAPGGAGYGSSNQPVDFGSGGGLGFGAPVGGGSQGGGALRLNVGGVLTVDGEISANGEPGLQDNSGGGSGGSIWVTAGTLAGGGQFVADGGAGGLPGGGGGAGGRIALYSHANAYFGLAAANGAEGDFAGADGTIYSNNVPPLQILSNSPNGIVSNAVSSVVLYFNDAPNPNSFSGSDVSLTAPNGPLPAGSFSVSMLSSASYLVSFPQQTAVGNYTLTVGTNIDDLYGQSMASAYMGTFSVSLPVIEGTITDTNGDPVAGVLLQASGGLSSTSTTDTNGNYALGFLPGLIFTVTPSQGAYVFVPSSRTYTDPSASISNQNFTAISIAPVLTAAATATNLALSWQAMPGVTYQVYSSTNLTDWVPYGNAITGSNGAVQVLLPIGSGPGQFFSVQASH